MDPAAEAGAAETTPSSEKQVVAMTTERLKFRVCQEVDQYGDKLLKRLDVFRKKNMFFDVALKTIDADFAAHKVVLAACGGIFRSRFVDAKTKRMDNSVAEVTFSCPAAGLRTILKFAYSGVLDITQSNVLPTLLAALATEMKEVQDICADLSISKIGWLLHFDGTETSLSLSFISNEGKTNKKAEDIPTLEQAFVLVHRVLELNAPNFASTDTLKDKDDSLTNNAEENLNDVLYPCLKEVENRWSKLRHVYISVMKCLREAEALNKSRHDDAVSTPVKTTNKEDSGDQSQYTNNKPVSNIEKDDTNKAEAVAETKLHDEVDVKPTVEVRSTTSSLVEKQIESSTPTQEIKAPRPTVRKTHSGESPKPPVTKPRKVSMKTHMRNNSSDQTETKKQPPPSPPKESPKPAPNTPAASKASQKLASAPVTPPSASPAPPRRKHAAPKPPGPPPSQTTRASSSPNLSRETPSKAPPPPKPGKATPSSAQKIPPPRPKPPSINKKEKKSDVSAATYDDKMNPFSDDAADEIVEADDKTSDSAQNKEDLKDEDYDDSLNPFEE